MFKTAGALGVITLLAACSPAAAPPVPTVAPAPAGQPTQPPAAAKPTTAPAAAPTTAAAGGAAAVASGGATPATANAQEQYLIPGNSAPKRGGTLMMALAGAASEPPHWDPVLGGLLPWAGGYMSPYEYLLQDRGAYFGDIEKSPGLAESWQTSSDGITWTFKIRQGVKWQSVAPVNGREFVADDVAWTFHHYAANSVLKSKYEIVESVNVPDKYTVVFTLKKAYAPFLPATLAHDFVILPHEIFDQYGDFKDFAVGTGPWIVDKWDRGSLMSFRPNPDYWQMGADGKPLPYMGAYKIFNYPDQAAVNAAIRAGQVDYYGPGVAGFYDQTVVKELKQSRPDLIYWDGQLSNFTGIEFNMKKAPWNNTKVRQAIALGIDKDEVINAAQNGDPVRSGLVPVPLTDYAWPLDKIKQRYPFDKDLAIQQLKDLGVVGTSIELTQNSPGPGGAPAPEAQVIATMLEDLGFKVNINSPQNVPAGMALIAAGKFDLSFYVHSTSFEIDDYVSRYWSTSGPLNTWGYSNPSFDQLCAQEQQELDPAKRKAIVDQAHELLYQDMVAIPIGSRPVHKVINPRLKNVRTPHYQNEHFAAIWIDG